MDNIQLRNLYVKKIAKSINGLEKKINLLSEIDRTIVNSLYNQMGGSDQAIKEELNSDILNANSNLLNLQYGIKKLESTENEVGDIYHKLLFLAGEVETIKELSSNIKTSGIETILSNVQSGSDGLPNPPKWWNDNKDAIKSGNIDIVLEEIEKLPVKEDKYLYLSTLKSALTKSGHADKIPKVQAKLDAVIALFP
jgi:hypothetical protein